MEKLFKYTPEDFGKLKVKVEHIDLAFDVFDDHTIVSSEMKLIALEDFSKIELDAKNLEITSVMADNNHVNYEYHKDVDKLVISFPALVAKDSKLLISIECITKPTSNILEGLYFDRTPQGAPPTMITQCQQWGFQRLTPCFDDMTAKCTYKTAITADKRYTSIISNGDPGPREELPGGRSKIIYDNTKTPMAPYLFFLGVGTYDIHKKELEYPDGDTFMLELLVFPGSDESIARKALDVLHDSAMWVHLFTGPGRYNNEDVSRRILDLIEVREKQKVQGKDLASVRMDLEVLSSSVKLGYKYTGKVYREISMQNSDFGGMENVGNTTIVANRIMPYSDMPDSLFEYLMKVKVHEYYHNLNGSEVTGMSPFEIWLNEAVTVFIERWFHSFYFGEDYTRLSVVLGLLSPGHGTLALDAGVASMPIEPEGFNSPNELISSITYIKAPEFVRMIETLLGKKNFVKALDNYHTKYKHSNASTNQWIECMEQVSGLDLKTMASGWLRQRLYPIVDASVVYDAKKLTVKLKQSGDQLWKFPFSVALLDGAGKVLAEKTEFVKERGHEIVFERVENPAVVSCNRGYSFYGKLREARVREELVAQLKLDKDVVNRYMAFYHLSEQEKIRLLENPSAEASAEFVEIFYSLISDRNQCLSLGSQMIVIFESSEDDRYAHNYQELYDVKRKMHKAIALAHRPDLLDLYAFYSEKSQAVTYLKQMVADIKRRQAKNAVLTLIASIDDEKAHSLIKAQFENADNATDKIIAFRLYVNSSAADKQSVIDAYEAIARKSLVAWELFLSVIGSNDSSDCLTLIRKVETSNLFKIEQSSDQRALFDTFASNRKKSLLTEEGRNFLKEKTIYLAPINEYNAAGMLEVFGCTDKIAESHRAEIFKTLLEILQKVDAKACPSVYNTGRRTLLGLPKAKESYEKKYGKLLAI